VTVVQSLIDLQEVDGRIRELELELKDLPRRKALETARLSGVSADLKSAKANEEYANQRVRNFEEDAKSLRERIQQLKTTQAGLKSNREYQQYSVQIDLINHDLDAMENNQMAAMDVIPSAQARVNEVQAKFDAEKSEVDAFCAEIDERIAMVKRELEEAQKERAEKAKLVTNPKFMLYYERLRTKRWPVVVPLTHEGVCDGCHLVQPPSVAQMVDHNADLVACTMCGRVLYRV
jgi:predicted  nucleic acid-binding Zn-ribbon protein